MIEQAQSAIDSAQASVDLLNAQMGKHTIRAPMDGVVLVRSIETGEAIQADMPTMTIEKLDTLKVTLYIPEDQYRKINLGQQATLNTDSFPMKVSMPPSHRSKIQLSSHQRTFKRKKDDRQPSMRLN